MISPESEPCPICSTTTSNLVHETTYPEHRYPGQFILRRCTGCGLLFNSPRLDDAALAQLYGRNYYFFQRKDAREFDRIVRMYQRTIGLITSEVSTKRAIDIGCGRGYFPAVLKELGWQAAGIEISPEAAQYGRERFNLDVFTGTLEQYAASAQVKRYPVVTAIDVIEHVPSPDAFIAAAAKAVEPGGFLIIDTPNGHAANIGLQGVAWKGFNPFHIYLFSVDNLTTLVERHGLKVIRSFSYGNLPADQQEAPLSLRMRDALVRSLRGIGLIGPAVRGYFALRKLMPRGKTPPQQHVKIAAERIRTEAMYPATEDAGAPLAEAKTGDNIVVIARKGTADERG